jgi:hypothetical protein
LTQLIAAGSCVTSSIPMLSEGAACSVVFAEPAEVLVVFDSLGGRREAKFLYSDLQSFDFKELTQKTGGGFAGGGFGLAGFAAGIVTAGVLNKLTTRKQTLLVLILGWTTGNVALLVQFMRLDGKLVSKETFLAALGKAYQHHLADAQHSVSGDSSHAAGNYTPEETQRLRCAPLRVASVVAGADGDTAVAELQAAFNAIAGHPESVMQQVPSLTLTSQRTLDLIAGISSAYIGRPAPVWGMGLIDGPIDSADAFMGIGKLLDANEDPQVAIEVKTWLSAIGFLVAGSESGLSHEEIVAVNRVAMLLGLPPPTPADPIPQRPDTIL